MSPSNDIEIYCDPINNIEAQNLDSEANGQLCSRCNSWKHKRHFIKRTKSSATPLIELANDVWEDIPGVKYNQQCNDCSNKRKTNQDANTRSKRKKLDNAKVQSIDPYSWERVLHLIGEGFTPFWVFGLL